MHIRGQLYRTPRNSGMYVAPLAVACRGFFIIMIYALQQNSATLVFKDDMLLVEATHERQCGGVPWGGGIAPDLGHDEDTSVSMT